MSGLGEIRGRKSDRAVTADPAEATKPLADVRILDLTRLLPGGYCTLLLADMGADVVKVEEPGRGDYIRWTPPMIGDESTAHRALNRGKRSIGLALDTPEGIALKVLLPYQKKRFGGQIDTGQMRGEAGVPQIWSH